MRKKEHQLRQVVTVWALTVMAYLLTGCNQLYPGGLMVTHKQPSNVASPQAHGKKVFLLMGQSNMVGAGQDKEFEPVGRVSMVDLSPNHMGYRGPGISFGAELVRCNPNIQIELRQYALNGSPMEYWYLGRIGWVPTIGYKAEDVAGILFFQGESDTITTTHIPWAMEFTEIVRSLRSQFNKPNLPVIFCQLGYQNQPSSEVPSWEYIRQEQVSVSMPYVSMVRTDDLAKNSPMHYPAESYWIIGERMARAYRGMEN